MHFTAIPALAALLLVACSGGSGGGASSANGDSSMLVVDGGAASEVAMTVQLQALALERIDGSITINLVAEGAPITVSDPAGRVAGVELQRIEPGVFVALHVALVEGSLLATQNGQSLTITPSSLLHRIEFDEPLSTMGGAAQRALPVSGGTGEPRTGRGRGGASLILAHEGRLRIENGVWTPLWVLRFGEEGLLRANIELASIDVANNRAEALAPRLSQHLVELDFSQRPDLLQGRGIGDEMYILARMTQSRSLLVLRLADSERGLGGFVRGNITALASAGDEFSIISDGAVIELTIESQTAFLRRDATGETPITFGDLSLNDNVVVFVHRPSNPNESLLARVVVVVD